jgi:protein-S-isoprenylcysteine O-methyltransferase Ste14
MPPADNMTAHDPHDRPAVRVYPPILIPVFVGAAIALEWLIPIQFLGPIEVASVQVLLGVFVALLAGALALSGAHGFRRAGTNIPPHLPSTELVTTGVYARVRNPMYLGMQLLLIGLGLIFSLEWCLLLWPVLALTLHFGVVRPEERYLTEKFGDNYADYTRRVQRWGLF